MSVPALISTYCVMCIKSDQMDIILLDPDPHSGHGDPDPFLFQPNVKLNYAFSRKFNTLSKFKILKA